MIWSPITRENSHCGRDTLHDIIIQLVPCSLSSTCWGVFAADQSFGFLWVKNLWRIILRGTHCASLPHRRWVWKLNHLCNCVTRYNLFNSHIHTEEETYINTGWERESLRVMWEMWETLIPDCKPKVGSEKDVVGCLRGSRDERAFVTRISLSLTLCLTMVHGLLVSKPRALPLSLSPITASVICIQMKWKYTETGTGAFSSCSYHNQNEAPSANLSLARSHVSVLEFHSWLVSSQHEKD